MTSLEYEDQIERARRDAKTLRRLAALVIVIAVAIIAVTIVFWLSDDLPPAISVLIVLFTLLGGLLGGDRALASATGLELAASRFELQLSLASQNDGQRRGA